MNQKFIFLFIVMLTNISLIAAQSTQTCSTLVQQALAQMGTNCANLNSNSACYGHLGVDAQFVTGANVDFNQPADRASLTEITGIQTAPLNETTGEWGISVMRLSANLPNSIPGQGVVFIMLGDAQLTNEVSEENIYLPDQSVEVLVESDSGEASLLSFPPGWGNRRSLEVGTITNGTVLDVDAVSEDGLWLRASFVSEKSPSSKRGSAWLSINDASEIDVSQLAVMNPTSRTQMQVFTLETGFGRPQCEEQPPSQIVIQGPSTLEVDLTSNGLDFRLTSTLSLQVIRSGNTCTMIFTPITGAVTIPDPNDPDDLDKAIVVTAGQFLEVAMIVDPVTGNCVVDPAWLENFEDIKADFDNSTDNFINQNIVDILELLQSIPENLLNYSLDNNTPIIISPSGIGNPVPEFRIFIPSDTN